MSEQESFSAWYNAEHEMGSGGQPIRGMGPHRGSPLPVWMPGDGTFLISWFGGLSAKAETCQMEPSFFWSTQNPSSPDRALESPPHSLRGHTSLWPWVLSPCNFNSEESECLKVSQHQSASDSHRDPSISTNRDGGCVSCIPSGESCPSEGNLL